MAKSQNGPSFKAELFRFNLYKRNQGRLVRQLTAVAVAVLIFFGTYTLSKGPLASYVNSYLTMTARYAGGQVNAKYDQSLETLAKSHGGQLAETKGGGRFRELTFHFVTSSRWTTDQDLVREMTKSGAAFAQEVADKHGSDIRLSAPRPQSRRAVGISVGIPVLLCLFGFWVVFRAINFPRFADFLISVEAEMDKVSWPGKPELYRSTVVVVTTMFLLGFMLLAFDVWWKWFFELIHFLRIPESKEAVAMLFFF